MFLKNIAAFQAREYSLSSMRVSRRETRLGLAKISLTRFPVSYSMVNRCRLRCFTCKLLESRSLMAWLISP